MSQRALARAIGVSPGAINMWLHGKRRPDAASREKIAALTGIATAEWLTDEERSQAQSASSRLNLLVPARRA